MIKGFDESHFVWDTDFQQSHIEQKKSGAQNPLDDLIANQSERWFSPESNPDLREHS